MYSLSGDALLYAIIWAPLPLVMATCLVLYVVKKWRHAWILYAVVYALMLLYNYTIATACYSSGESLGIKRYFMFLTGILYLPLGFTIAVMIAPPIKQFIILLEISSLQGSWCYH
jgi:hypothetical protein